MEIGITITDLNGTVSYVNPAFSKTTGYASEEIIGKSPRILQSGLTAPETYEEMWATLTAGRMWEGEFTNKRKDGGIYHEKAIIAPIREADDQAARRGKVIADALSVIQLGERKAWQLDVPETSGEVPGELKIVIERV